MNEVDKMLKEKHNQDDAGDIKELLKKNLEMTVEVHEMVKKIKSYILWQQIFGFLKLLIIVIPLIIGIMYLPPLLQKIVEQYNELLGAPTDGIMDILK